MEVAYVGSKITRVGIPDTNLNQLTVDQLAQGASLLQRVPNPYFGTIPRSSSLGDPTIPVAQLLKPYPQYTTVSLYRNNVGTTIYHGVYAKLEQRFSRGLSYLVSYTRSKLMDDASSVFDASILTGPVANFPVADSFNRRLERDYSNGDIPHVFVASAVWDMPFGANRRSRASGVAGRARERLDADRRAHAAVGHSARHRADDQQQRVRGVRHAAAEPDRRPDASLPTSGPSAAGSTRAPSPRRRRSRIGTSSRNPVRGPGYRNLDLALMRRVPLPGGKALEVRAEVFNADEHAAARRAERHVGSAAFGTITSAGDPRVVQLAVKLILF